MCRLLWTHSGWQVVHCANLSILRQVWNGWNAKSQGLRLSRTHLTRSLGDDDFFSKSGSVEFWWQRPEWFDLCSGPMKFLPQLVHTEKHVPSFHRFSWLFAHVLAKSAWISYRTKLPSKNPQKSSKRKPTKLDLKMPNDSLVYSLWSLGILSKLHPSFSNISCNASMIGW